LHLFDWSRRNNPLHDLLTIPRRIRFNTTQRHSFIFSVLIAKTSKQAAFRQ
jgi:hypothetical protein